MSNIYFIIFKSRLKMFFFHSGIQWTLNQPTASTSEVTTIWDYINLIIIIIIIIRLSSVIGALQILQANNWLALLFSLCDCWCQ